MRFGDGTPEQELYDHLRYAIKEHYNLSWMEVIKVIIEVMKSFIEHDID